MLPKRACAEPLWFATSKGTLRESIDRRNKAFDSFHESPTRINKVKYATTRRIARVQARQAKSDWILSKCKVVNDGMNGSVNGKTAWEAVRILKFGLTPSRRVPPTTQRRVDGSLATFPEEVASISSSHFSNLYARQTTFESSILDLLPQAPHFPNLDASPFDDAILQAINKLHSTSLGASGVHARLWQALSSTTTGFDFIRHFVVHFWLTETPPTEWEFGLLRILQKNSDLHNPENLRGIMMMEVAYTIVAIILHNNRLKPI